MENNELDDKLIIITPLGKTAAKVKPDRIISETTVSKTLFIPKLVNDKLYPSHKIEGDIEYERLDNKNLDISGQINKNTVRHGGKLKFHLDSKETYKLYIELNSLFNLANQIGNIPFREEKYIKINNEEELNIFNEILSDPIKVRNFLNNLNNANDLYNLRIAANLKTLKSIESEIESNLEKDEEAFWQSLFNKNTWVLSQLFTSPYIYFSEKIYVGGKNIHDKEGGIADFAYKNKIDNIFIIEIKTPCKELILQKEYRGINVHNLSENLIGGINQVLFYKQTLNNNYSQLLLSGNDKFRAINIDSILLIGNLKSLQSDENRKEFENFRNELKSVRIVTFDELLTKIKIMIELLEKEN